MTNSTADIATALETTPRELRKFLRSSGSGFESVGKGSRYALPGTKRDIASMRKRFDAWTAAKVAERVEIEITLDEDAVEDFDDLVNPLDA